ncbi:MULTISPECIES: hypothetical protein [unclassified Streptomyces]|uniref:hypothetical protein n=1 Tax=unclassified Streptomyces TaxID=2593676 RepID=UPI0002F0B46F|nr:MULTISPECIES: hypothetical protein [unclassified Streptomyces]NED31331.1 hypothetical protein [Streptomyces sp. SID8499]
MESGPAIFTGAVFALFGAALLAWVASRAPRREPVAAGVGRAASAALATLAALASLAVGVWCFTRL